MSILKNELSSLLGGSSESWSWPEQLHAASFRGVPFAVVTGETTFGRRQAVHDYPYRDMPWVEDMGRSARQLTLNGFIVQDSQLYSASDIITQRDSLVAACETSGVGTLVHPTLGELTVSISEGGLKINEAMTSGRSFEFTLTVIEAGLKVFAITGAQSSASRVNASWLSLLSKAAATFIAEVSGDLRTVAQTLKMLTSPGQFWVKMVTNVSDQASNINNILKSTFGTTRYGRYNDGTVGGNASGATDTTDTTDDTTDYDTLVAQRMAKSIENRQAIDEATHSFLLSSTLSDYAANALAVIEALNSSTASLSDLIRALESLSAFSDTAYHPEGSDSEVAAAAQIYFITLAAGAMANAASQYSPSSYDDAMGVLSRLIAVIDRVALAVADTGYDEVYSELQVLRTVTVSTLQIAGADLARITLMDFERTLPALNIANRLYQDATRAESLVKMADPVHPAFMPTQFKALKS